jgi:hypothetical protein
MLSYCSAIFLTHPSTSSPQHFPFPSVAPRRTSTATPGRRRQPPTPPPSPDPVLLEHRHNPLVLPSPSNFVLPHPNIISRSAGELKAPLPLGLAVNPSIQSLLALAKHTVSTTSSRGSSSTTFLPPSGTLATGTPSTPLGAPPPARLRRRYAASAPPFPDTGHPRDRRESLVIFPHLPLAAGEPPHQIWSPSICSPVESRPRA